MHIIPGKEPKTWVLAPVTKFEQRNLAAVLNLVRIRQTLTFAQAEMRIPRRQKLFFNVGGVKSLRVHDGALSVIYAGGRWITVQGTDHSDTDQLLAIAAALPGNNGGLILHGFASDPTGVLHPIFGVLEPD